MYSIKSIKNKIDVISGRETRYKKVWPERYMYAEDIDSNFFPTIANNNNFQLFFHFQ
jgi:hypothetical protein